MNPITLKEIENSLPNGFHDARISRINIDYVKRVLTLDLELWVSDTEDGSPDTFRAARLTLTQFQFCIIEPPDPTYPFHQAKELWVDGSLTEPVSNSSPIPSYEELPDGTFTGWFFVHDWNAFIHIAALDASVIFL
jgi:hypothetical protein